MPSTRRGLPVRYVCLAAVSALILLVPGRQAIGTAAAATPAAASPAAAATGSSDTVNLGAGGWAVQSSAVATQTGAQISTPGFSTSTWLPVTNDDAGAPGTEIEALVQNGKCPGDTALQPVNQNPDGPRSIWFSANLKSCYGSMSTIGPDTVAAFDSPCCGRPASPAALQPARAAPLVVNGWAAPANLWVKGNGAAPSSGF